MLALSWRVIVTLLAVLAAGVATLVYSKFEVRKRVQDETCGEEQAAEKTPERE